MNELIFVKIIRSLEQVTLSLVPPNITRLIPSISIDQGRIQEFFEGWGLKSD